jgi:hypothetical protein
MIAGSAFLKVWAESPYPKYRVEREPYVTDELRIVSSTGLRGVKHDWGQDNERTGLSSWRCGAERDDKAKMEEGAVGACLT